MGYDAYAVTIFGVKSDINDFEVTEKKRGCEHKIDKDAKFCSQCGKPAYITDTFIPDELYQEKYKGVDIIRPNSDSNEIYLGVLIGRTDYNKKSVCYSKGNITQLIDKTIERLSKIEEIAIFDVAFWTVLEESY